MLKKVLSVLLVVVMVLPLLSSTALGAGAEDEIKFKYDEICAEDGPVICVGQNGKWGLVDTRTGDEILPCEYENNTLRDGGEGFIHYTKYVEEIGGYRSAYLDKTGKAITPFKYPEFYCDQFQEGLVSVMATDDYKFGFIDKTGEEVIPIIYDSVSWFCKGIATVEIGDFWALGEGESAYIDKSGNEIVPFGRYDYIGWPNDEGYACVVKDMGDNGYDGYRYGLIDNTGKEVLPCQYDSVFLADKLLIWNEEGLAAFWQGKECTIVDKCGRVILQSDKYDEFGSSWNGLIHATKAGKDGYVDIQTGEEVIPCIYDWCFLNEDGYAGVNINGKYGIVDKTGKEAIPCIYDGLYTVEANCPYVVVMLNDEKIILDRNGKKPMKYDNVAGGDEKYGLQGVHSDTGWGAVDSTGKEIVPCQYDDLALAHGYVKVRNYDDMAGLFDSKGNEILPREYDDITIVSETLVAVWENGKYGFLYLGDKSAAPTTTAYASTQKVLVDGKAVEFQCYALRDASGNDTNYIKLRDMAAILNGSAAQFNVNYDGNIVIETKKPYTTANGTEMNTPFSGDREYKTNTDVTKIDGVASDLAAITLTDDQGGGYTYYKLRDLGQALGFNVGWDNVKGNIFIETDKPYDPNN